jgi:large subunit ribosomal protein L20
LLTLAKGYYLNKSKLYKFAKESVEKALVYAYRDRKVRKREFRRLWIVRIGAAARINGLNYNQFMFGLKQAGVDMDRKILADLAIQDPAAFTRLTDTAKGAIQKTN